MADDTRVAKRYAAALFAIAERDDVVEKTLDEMLLVGRFIAEVPYLRTVLYQPLVSRERKTKVLTDAFASRVSATTLNALILLVNKRRETLTEVVIADFQRRVDEHLGKVVAEVKSAVVLTDKQLDSLGKSLVLRTGKLVEIKASLDPSMIGGVEIRLGDNVIDGSVRTRLESLRQQLLTAR